jgi:hypothetical protein
MTSDEPPPDLDWPGVGKAEAIIRLVSDAELEPLKVRLLCDTLNGLKQHCVMYFRQNDLSTATERVRWSKSMRRALKKAIRAKSQLSFKTFAWPSGIFRDLITHKIAGEFQPRTQRQATRNQRELKRLLEEEPSQLLSYVEAFIAEASADAAANRIALKVKPGARRDSDKGLDRIFLGLLDAYELTFNQCARISTNAGLPSGPLLRFLVACLEILGIRTQSPEGIRDRVRKLNRARADGLPNANFRLAKCMSTKELH